MNERLIDVVLGSLATVLAQKLAAFVLARRNGNSAPRTLRAARELVDLVSCVEDLMRRMSDAENSLEAVTQTIRKRFGPRRPGE